MARRLVVSNVSNQVIPILVSSLPPSLVSASSTIPADLTGEFQMAPGSSAIVEERRVDLAQLRRLFDFQLIVFTRFGSDVVDEDITALSMNKPQIPRLCVGDTYFITGGYGVGGVQPYRYDIVSGALPDGLDLNPENGIITGTTTTRSRGTVQIRVTDHRGNTAVTKIITWRVMECFAYGNIGLNAYGFGGVAYGNGI